MSESEHKQSYVELFDISKHEPIATAPLDKVSHLPRTGERIFLPLHQPGDWGEDRSSTTAFGYRDLEPSLPLTRNDTQERRTDTIIAVYVGHIAQARQIENRSGDVFDRSGTMFEAARRRLRGLSSGRATETAKD